MPQLMHHLKTVIGLLGFFASTAIQAHVPFLKPSQFNIENDRLQIESTFTEFPFQPDFAMDSPNFSMTHPSGNIQPLQPSAKTRAAVYLEPVINATGTYRVSTGVRAGPTYKAVETADGKLYFADDKKHTKGTPVSMKYYSSADVYLVKGAPTYVPRPLGSGVEIIPLSSPNHLVAGKRMQLQVLHGGKPLAEARVITVYADEHYKQHRIEDLYDVENVRTSNIIADQAGRFSITPLQGGLMYLLVTLHQKTSLTEWESHNGALTLEVGLPNR